MQHELSPRHVVKSSFRNEKQLKWFLIQTLHRNTDTAKKPMKYGKRGFYTYWICLSEIAELEIWRRFGIQFYDFCEWQSICQMY